MDLSDGLKKIFLAGVGAVAMTADATKDLVDQLVKKGELTVEQGKALNEELKHNVKDKVNDHVTVKIIKEYKDVLNAVDHMSKEELELLKEKLAKAEAANAKKAEDSDSSEDQHKVDQEGIDGQESGKSETIAAEGMEGTSQNMSDHSGADTDEE